MKLLKGRELAGFIKQRQAKEVRRLKQSEGISPKLAIVQTLDSPIINTYVGLKKRYGSDIGIEVEIHHPPAAEAVNLIDSLNNNPAIHGIIVQLPLNEPVHTERVVNSVAPEKDVDGLANQSQFNPATPTAIIWLLSGYNIELSGKKVVVIGTGPLVGAPLAKQLRSSGIEPIIADSKTENLKTLTLEADVIISAAGRPGLITADMLKKNAVIIDAGTAVADGKTIGDVDPSVLEREDLTATPAKGGVGPLTVSSLFENVLQAARSSKAN